MLPGGGKTPACGLLSAPNQLLPRVLAALREPCTHTPGERIGAGAAWTQRDHRGPCALGPQPVPQSRRARILGHETLYYVAPHFKLPGLLSQDTACVLVALLASNLSPASLVVVLSINEWVDVDLKIFCSISFGNLLTVTDL